MKKLIGLILAAAMLFSFTVCGYAFAESESDDSEAWAQLDALGKIQTENGILYTYVTIPALLMDDMTQEKLDASAADGNYTQATLNEDGSATYKLTKSQHKAMLEELTANIDSALREMVDDPDYTFTKIEHSDDYSVFDLCLSTDEIGFLESFSLFAIYMFGGLYHNFAGVESDIIANFYNPAGELIGSYNSADM